MCNFNDLFQYRKRYGLHAIRFPQAEKTGKAFPFQYRKRYGLHAIKLHTPYD